MSRYERPKFNFADWSGTQGVLPGPQPSDQERNGLLFDWWCDNGGPKRESDRLSFIAALNRKTESFPSRAPLQDDPAPLLTSPAPQGFRDVFLISDPEDVCAALKDADHFSNIPYAALGGASFILGLDPGPGFGNFDWHAEQKALIGQALAYDVSWLRVLARHSVKEAALTSLASPDFDLASFAEQAALRYLGRLFGYGFQDHPLLEDAARATYRALQYLAIGQHFVTEPGTLPAAQQALGRLIARTSQLMEEYTRLERSPRRYGRRPARDWPTGVQPWSDVGLSHLGEPLLKRLPQLNGSGQTRSLSGRDRATVAATLLAGTLGNIQSAVCLLTESLLTGPPEERMAVRRTTHADSLEAQLERRMAARPPLPVVPRRTNKNGATLPRGGFIPADTDCLLLLENQFAATQGCPHVWGTTSGDPGAPHGCLGRELSMPLIAALVQHTLELPGLKSALDPLTGDRLVIERLWGFACVRYPLRFESTRYRVQQNLIVSMPVKPPISENAAALRRLIAAGVPRIEHVLTGFGHLHFAWFEFSDNDSQLVLRTIYDGEFDPYVQYFAMQAGDLFDGLFDFLEGAPRRPVSEHPQEFVEMLRRLNRVPVGGYLYSAYPSIEADQIR